MDQTRAQLEDRSHFFAIAAMTMRRILLRLRSQAWRGSARRRTGLARQRGACGERAGGGALLAMDHALDRLAEIDARRAEIVELRFLTGLTEAQTAEILGVSQRTVARAWAVAKGWLYQELNGESG